MAVRTLTAELHHDGRAELAEAPRWDARSGELIWVDILAGEVHMLESRSGKDRVLGLGRHVGAVVPRRSGGYAAAVREGFAALGPGGEEETLAVFFDDEERRMNDARCDRAGRLWASSMTYDRRPGAASLVVLDADRTAREVIGGVSLGNGIDWSPDDTTMYFVDTPTRAVDALDYDLASGHVENRRVLFEVPEGRGWPDGIAVDAEGCIWVGVYGGGRVERRTPEGDLDTVVETPGAPQVTAPGFGGSGLATLFITTASEAMTPDELAAAPRSGGIFVAEPGVAGQPTSMYAG